MTGEDNHEQKPSILGKITEGYHEGKRDAEEDVRARAGKDNHEQKPSILDKITEGYHEGKHKAEEDEHARAAAKIQKVWREKKGRAQADYLSSELRWRDAAIRARAKIHRTSADAGKNSAKERWNRGVFFASKLREENEVLKKPGTEDTDPNALRVEKHLETQHWLELVDAKHRYGSNRK
ncbi:hypothetical protein BT96DRAFT_25814 [Gymnopus androsaceus JB14]|uniref:Uncharacterized protein n=1 Tax=Gymnopus androsaceus JB14 TaxID=1447944 RepID=A0A6A4IHX5_9AGAR|nr:hypothetical protein BT96DRAFT_25814 [Gymnopus androsaceus JB14]